MKYEELKYKVFDWLRFPLIVFVVYIHSFGEKIDFSAINFDNLLPLDYYNLFRISISHVLTHIAVPMFFFISGYLFFNKLHEWKYSIYFSKLKKRIKTLLVPFILWNTITILLKIQSLVRNDGLSSLWDFFKENNYGSLYWNCEVWNLDRVDWLGIPTPSSSPYLIPLWYLRDLMVTIIISPIFYYLFKYAKTWGLFILFICYISLIGFKMPGFSTTALFFFGAGAYFNLNNIDPTQFSYKYRYPIYGLALILWIFVTRYDGHNTPVGNIIYPFYIVIGSISMFNLATAFVKNGIHFPHILTKSSFFIYVVHTIMITGISSIIIKKLIGNDSIALMTISYFLAPLLTVTICVLIYWFMNKYLHKLCSLLTGER